MRLISSHSVLDACGFQICDSNADCTPGRQCRCKTALGFVGNGSHCKFGKQNYNSVKIESILEYNLLLDPCTPGYHSCSDTEDCKRSGNSFTCSCKRGYRREHSVCVLADPCAPGVSDCDKNAFCVRRPDFTYRCHCYRGFIGDGKVCLGNLVSLKFGEMSQSLRCLDMRQCHRDAYRVGDKCYCKRGFVGNGAFCCRESNKCCCETVT